MVSTVRDTVLRHLKKKTARSPHVPGHVGPEWEWRHSTTLSLTSALDWWREGGVNITARPFYPVPIYRNLGGPLGRLGQARKNSPHLDSIADLPFLSYTDGTIPAQNMHEYTIKQHRPQSAEYSDSYCYTPVNLSEVRGHRFDPRGCKTRFVSMKRRRRG